MQLSSHLNCLIFIFLLINGSVQAGFVGTAQVYTPTGKCQLRHLKPDDLVWGYGFAVSKPVVSQVKKHVIKKAQEVWCVQLIRPLLVSLSNQAGHDLNITDSLILSPNQKLFLVHEKKWRSAQNLKQGDLLLTITGVQVQVEAAYKLAHKVDLHALEVINCHNFFVSHAGILVHNEPLSISIGIALAFGGGGIEFAGLTVGAVIASLVGVKIGIDRDKYSFFANDDKADKSCLPGITQLDTRPCAGVASKQEVQNVSEQACLRSDTPELASCNLGLSNAPEPMACNFSIEPVLILPEQVSSVCNSASASMLLQTKTEVVQFDTKKAVNDILATAIPGEKTGGRTDQFHKPGKYAEAKSDFDSLRPKELKPIDKIEEVALADGTIVKVKSEGWTGILEDGTRVNVRAFSSGNKPTLEIQHNERKTKIRYE